MYRVTWEIDIDAGSPREAAELCLALHRDPDSTATFFMVEDDDGNKTTVDLQEEEA